MFDQTTLLKLVLCGSDGVCRLWGPLRQDLYRQQFGLRASCFQAWVSFGALGVWDYSPPQVDRICGIWRSCYKIPNAILYLLKADYTWVSVRGVLTRAHVCRAAWVQS